MVSFVPYQPSADRGTPHYNFETCFHSFLYVKVRVVVPQTWEQSGLYQCMAGNIVPVYTLISVSNEHYIPGHIHSILK